MEVLTCALVGVELGQILWVKERNILTSIGEKKNQGVGVLSLGRIYKATVECNYLIEILETL